MTTLRNLYRLLQPWFGISNLSYRDNIPVAPDPVPLDEETGEPVTTDDVVDQRGSLHEPPLALGGLPGAGPQPPHEPLVATDLGHLCVIDELLLADPLQRRSLDQIREGAALGLRRFLDLRPACHGQIELQILNLATGRL